MKLNFKTNQAKIALTNHIEIVSIVGSSDKAILVDLGHAQMWLPKSEMTMEYEEDSRGKYYMLIPEDWLARKIEKELEI